jgi:carbon starvation protein
MLVFAIVLGAAVLLLAGYTTYGRWLATRIFRLDASTPMPSSELRDDVDYVPTPRAIVFGHHFTSIAGTGPIVGPALAIMWGWMPALVWVLIGSIFVGAMHDMAALVVSCRNRGMTIGEVAGRLSGGRNGSGAGSRFATAATAAGCAACERWTRHAIADTGRGTDRLEPGNHRRL